ncbi:MAG: hypothetical protein HY721_01145 [Planctomycetes bacterium]|nr:hypothetical protein [Planctomycetota bacterium]
MWIRPTDGAESAFALVAEAPRSALRPATLVPVWLGVLGLDALGRADLPWRTPCLAGLLLLALPVAQGWVALGVEADLAGRRTGLGERARRLRSRLSSLLLVPLVTVFTPALLAAIAVGGALLGLVPGAGKWLLGAWVATGGAAFALLAAAWAAAAVPAVPLEAAGSVLDPGASMEVAARALGYVRRRPLLLACGWLGALAAAAAACAMLLFVLSLALACLHAALEVGCGTMPDPVEAARHALGLWPEPVAAWARGLLPASGGAGGGPVFSAQAARVASHLLGTLAAAFLAAAVLSGQARLYLVLRRAVDAVALRASPRQSGGGRSAEQPPPPGTEH